MELSSGFSVPSFRVHLYFESSTLQTILSQKHLTLHSNHCEELKEKDWFGLIISSLLIDIFHPSIVKRASPSVFRDRQWGLTSASRVCLPTLQWLQCKQPREDSASDFTKRYCLTSNVTRLHPISESFLIASADLPYEIDLPTYHAKNTYASMIPMDCERVPMAAVARPTKALQAPKLTWAKSKLVCADSTLSQRLFMIIDKYNSCTIIYVVQMHTSASG